MSSALVLAGPPGAGKSTVGALCAERLRWRFVDTDAELTRRLGLPVAELFARGGEAYFRAQEAALIGELAAASQTVISVGGGAVIDERSREVLLRLGVSVCLTATPLELARRLGPDAGATRPLLRGTDLSERLAALLRERATAYRALPYHLDTTGMTPDAVAALVCGLVTAEHERLRVSHPTGHYDLVLGTDLLRYLGHALAGRGYRGPLAIVSDTNVGPLYAEQVQASLQAAGLASFVIQIPAGEEHKNLRTLEQLHEALSAGGVERGGALLALGGGVVGDTAGLAAATYLRGIGLVAVPTSLLAMADSSIGGKVGVDLATGKNLVGAFKHPELVVTDLACLATLPAVELNAGLAEVIKAALIAGGAAFARVQSLAPPLVGSPQLAQVLGDALQLKRTLVQEDPQEHGRRVLLNLGHTFAHGLEPWSGYQLRHGEAVALGLVCAARLSARLGLCDSALSEQLTHLLHRLGLPTMLPMPSVIDDAVESIWAFMQRDKKRLSRKNRFVLLRAPGDIVTCDFVEDQLARDTVRALFGE